MSTEETFQQAIQRFSHQQHAEAAALARQGLEQYPDDARLWQVLGTSLWALKEHAAALTALEMATTLAPLLPLPQRALADCYAQAGKADLAVTIYRHLVECKSCPTDLLPNVAASLNKLEQFELALQACEQLTQRNPANHQAYFGIAYYLRKLGALPAKLLEPLAMALDLAPQTVHYRINLAFVWAELGDFDLARQILGPVAIDEVCAPCWLRRMQAIFERVGDRRRAGEC